VLRTTPIRCKRDVEARLRRIGTSILDLGLPKQLNLYSLQKIRTDYVRARAELDLVTAREKFPTPLLGFGGAGVAQSV
jgi:hypothetical protein